MTTIYLPVMTSNTSPTPFTVTASSNSADAFKAFNSSATDSWSPVSSNSTEYLEADLVVSTVINKIQVRCPAVATSPLVITVQGAGSGYPAFTTVQTFTGLIFTANTYLDLNITANSPAYRYYRIVLTNQGGVATVIDSVIISRNSTSSTNAIPRLPQNIKTPNTFLLFQYWDIALFRQPVSNSNYSRLLFFQQGVVPRPITGQLFPRGYPVEKATITTISPVAVNLTDYTGTNGFSIKQIAGINTTPYLSNLTASCSTVFQPPGSFCNQLYPNDPDVLWKHDWLAAATWELPNTATSTGVLVIDLGASVDFNSASIFQMFADSGKVTHVQLFKHSNSSTTFPVHTDAGWVSIAPESVIGAGTTGYNGKRTSDKSILSNPTKLVLPATNSRYLKIHCRNTGIHGEIFYIILGGFKLFNI